MNSGNLLLLSLLFSLAAFVPVGGADDAASGNTASTVPTASESTVSDETSTNNSTAGLDLSAAESNDIDASRSEQANGSNTVKDTADNSTAIESTVETPSTPAGTDTSLGDNSTVTTPPDTEKDNSTATTINTTEASTAETTPAPAQTDASDNETMPTSNNTAPAVEPTEPTSVTNQTGQPSTAETTEKSSTAGSTHKPVVEHSARISETNMLMVDADHSDSLFFELKGKAGEDLTGLWLIVHDAMSGATTPHFKLRLESAMDDKGLYLLNNMTGLKLTEELAMTGAVFIGLYENEPTGGDLTTDGLLDALLYSSHGSLDQSLQETFVQVTRFPLTLDFR
ncbi:hypothetical protein ElyMa_004679400 [Elysia marginata]|uniref:Laminin G domain-containing protein n=1 Tax=Elysia marginata TaxID=1093978 RepID=A0AAV4I4Y3_9GAST|nr:hypothetical protein ElyMa_004679400 [Elysia marginata]